jgi:tetratricopeptide (TPR) repeat protein
LISLSGLLMACAQDPAMGRWNARRGKVEQSYNEARLEAALAGFERLARTALKPVDRQHMELRQARTLSKLGRDLEAVRIYAHLARAAIRRMDRARARYELARYAEDQGHPAQAVALYRKLVLTYPELMPGLRALQHLERLALEAGRPEVEAHLAWTQGVLAELERTPLGDNLYYFAARQAYERFRAEGDPGFAAAAEHLYLEIGERFPKDGHWDDALWELSWLYHHLGRFPDEIGTLERIVSTRQRSSFMGNYEHVYYWVGQLRTARAYLVDLDRPADAASTYAWFLAEYPISRFRDDALFWQGCAYLRLGDRIAAESAFARIPENYAESKYLARLDRARENPRDPVCTPNVFEEAEW